MKIRRCEAAVFKSGLVLAVVLALYAINIGQFHYSALTGYLLGFASFVVLAEGFAALENAPKRLAAINIMFSNLKLLFFGIVVFYLARNGFSVREIAVGTVLSQLAILFSFFLDSSP